MMDMLTNFAESQGATVVKIDYNKLVVTLRSKDFLKGYQHARRLEMCTSILSKYRVDTKLISDTMGDNFDTSIEINCREPLT